jgi:flagellar biosynthesis protein FlhB
MPEPVQRHDQPVNRSSNRQFGLVMAGFFAILAAIAAWRGSGSWIVLWLVIAAAFAASALTMPSILAPLNRLWFRFGLLLHKVMTPLIMALMFFVVITPIALVMRLFGKRPIPLRFDKAADSYWIARDPAGPGPMSKQY